MPSMGRRKPPFMASRTAKATSAVAVVRATFSMVLVVVRQSAAAPARGAVVRARRTSGDLMPVDDAACTAAGAAERPGVENAPIVVAITAMSGEPPTVS